MRPLWKPYSWQSSCHVPVAKAEELVLDDCIEYEAAPIAVEDKEIDNEDAAEPEEAQSEAHLTKAMVDIYVAAVVELYEKQVADDTSGHPHPCRHGVERLLHDLRHCSLPTAAYQLRS